MAAIIFSEFNLVTTPGYNKGIFIITPYLCIRYPVHFEYDVFKKTLH
jgi:hypothetical protein